MFFSTPAAGLVILVISTSLVPSSSAQIPYPPGEYNQPQYKPAEYKPEYKAEYNKQPDYKPEYRPAEYSQPAYSEPAAYNKLAEYAKPAYAEPAYKPAEYAKPAYAEPAYKPAEYAKPAYAEPAYKPTEYKKDAYSAPAEYPPPMYQAPVASYPQAGGYTSNCLVTVPQTYGTYGSACITAADVNDALAAAISYHGAVQDKNHWKAVADIADILLTCTTHLINKFKIPAREAAILFPQINTMATNIYQICPDQFKPGGIKCTYSRYLRYDGLCNNPYDPTIGGALRPLRRLLPNAYADGLAEPRVGKGGYYLPNAREISNIIHYELPKHESTINMMWVHFGQLLDHEVVHSTQFIYEGKRNHWNVDCCHGYKHRDCWPITIPRNDPWYANFGQNCMNYLRVRPGLYQGCTLGPRTQYNRVTPVIDASALYGSNLYVHNLLKDPKKAGWMRVQYLPGNNDQFKGIMPPRLENPDYECFRANKNQYCFLAGDDRSNSQVPLSTAHIIFLRAHNWFASQLHKVNPHWDSYKLFEETRRIMAASQQHMTISEWISPMLDPYTIKKNGLYPAELYRYDYDGRKYDPQITHAFSTAAFRLCHSMLPNYIKLYSTNHKFLTQYPLWTLLLNPDHMYQKGKLDQYLVGSLHQPADWMDAHITNQVRNELFREPYGKFGQDLAARNIERAREHGVPGYLAYRKWCYLQPVVYNWNDLRLVMSNYTVNQLSRLYKNIEDVDLFTGALSEFRIKHWPVGPTLACIIGEQFGAIVKGDNYWHENPKSPSAFTPDQLKVIKQVKWARWLCDFGDYIESVQVWSFLLPDYEKNPMVQCKGNSYYLPHFNFEPWREKPAYNY